MKTGQRGQSMSCCAAKATNRGKGFPLGAPCGVACGQALQPCGLTGGLPTGSRLRRACTPFLIEKFPGNPKPITIQAHSRAPLPRHGSTYLSGNAVQTNRATSVCRVWRRQDDDGALGPAHPSLPYRGDGQQVLSVQAQHGWPPRRVSRPGKAPAKAAWQHHQRRSPTSRSEGARAGGQRKTSN